MADMLAKYKPIRALRSTDSGQIEHRVQTVSNFYCFVLSFILNFIIFF